MTYAQTLRQAKADAFWLSVHWPDLIEERIPGTARPWRQTEMESHRRAELDAAARAERLERVDLALGESAAPVHVDVLDVLNDLAAELGSPANLRNIANELRAWEPDQLEDFAGTLTVLVRETALALRLIYDGQRLDGSCPWCRQSRSLVIRTPAPAEEESVPTTPPGPILVVCEGRAKICMPPESDCGTYVHGVPPKPSSRDRGRPAWPDSEWTWLAQRILHDEAIQPQYLAPARPAKVYRVRDAHGREGCHLWQGARADLPGPSHTRSCGRADCVRSDHIIRTREDASA